MTSFLSPALGAGFGGQATPSTSTTALQDINSQNQTFANKDFVKNIAYLNQSTDTLSQWSQKLQAGVDKANQNALEQIQGFYADLFVLFAGFSPTGINVGDVKYVLQGIGALFGINPGTPFPMNLVDAAMHMFTTYIVPSAQFTDIIFEAIDAWAIDLGLSPEFVASMKDLQTSINALGQSFTDLFTSIGKLLDALGPDLTPFLSLVDSLFNLFNLIDTTALKPVIQELSVLGIPFINALTTLVNTANTFLGPLSSIAGSQISTLGSNVCPPVSNQTTTWSLAGDAASGWVWDSNQTASSTSAGSLTTYGTGVLKRVWTQTIFPANPGAKFTVNAQLRWQNVPSTPTDFGMVLVWFLGANEVGSTFFPVASGHGPNGGWAHSVSMTDVVVPQNVDGMRIGARIDVTIDSGQVWIDDLSVQLQGGVSQSAVTGLPASLAALIPFSAFNSLIPGLPGGTNAAQSDIVTYLESLIPTTFFDPLTGHTGTTQSQLTDWFGKFLTSASQLDLGNAVGLLDPQHFPLIPLGQLAQTAPNLLVNPSFDSAQSIDGQGIWFWDNTIGHSAPGSVYVDANSITKELVSNRVPVAQGQQINTDMQCRWTGLTYTGTQPFQVDIVGYLGNSLAPVTVTTLGAPVSPATASAPEWQQFGGSYTVPAGVDSVRLRLMVNDTASAGRVWFDDGTFTESSLIPQGYVQGLLSQFTSVTNAIGLKLDLTQYNSLLNSLAGFGSGQAGLTDIANRLVGLATGGAFDASKLTNVGNIPPLGQNSITGLTSALGARALLTDFNSLMGVLGAGTGTTTAIGNRLQFLNPAGLFDSANLTNLINHPPLPNAAVPGLTTISDLVTQALVNPSSTGNPLGTIGSNLGSLLDNVRQGADGTSSTGAVIPDLFNAFTSLRQGISANAVALSQIQSVLPTAGGGGSAVTGNSFTDDAERAAGNGYGPGWLTLGPTSPYAISTDGHRWNWTDSGGSVRTQYGIYTAGQTLSDYQSIKDVMSSLMESPQAWTGAGPNSNNWLIGRANATGTRFVIAVRFYNQVSFYDFNNGTYTQIGTAFSCNPRAGAPWELECGNASSLRHFTLYMGGAIVGQWDDAGSITALGATNRYGGQGQQSDARSGGEATPGSIDLWSIADKIPVAPGSQVGSGARIFRTSTSTFTIPGAAMMPTSVFGSIDKQTNDITVDLVNGKFTVSIAAWYDIDWNYLFSSQSSSGGLNSIYKNGTLYEYAGGWAYQSLACSGHASIYLVPGDYVQLGANTSFTLSGTGNASGTATWMSIQMANRSTL